MCSAKHVCESMSRFRMFQLEKEVLMNTAHQADRSDSRPADKNFTRRRQEVTAVAKQLLRGFPQGSEGQAARPCCHQAQNHIHRTVMPQALLCPVPCVGSSAAKSCCRMTESWLQMNVSQALHGTPKQCHSQQVKHPLGCADARKQGLPAHYLDAKHSIHVSS